MKELLQHARVSHGSPNSEAVWLRLSAFFSLKAPNTQETYRGILAEWCAFLKCAPGTPTGAKALVAAKDLHAIAYRRWLEGRPGERPRERTSSLSTRRSVLVERHRPRKKEGLEAAQSNATIAKKLAALRRMYRVLIGAGCGPEVNPFDSDLVPPPAKEAGRKRPTRMLAFERVRGVIQLANETSPKGLRDKAILSALFGGALRRSEVLGLRVGDVRVSPSGTTFLYLRSTKAKRDAQQALPEWAAKIVKKLAAQRRAEGAEEGDYLCISYRGRGGAVPTRERVSASGIYKLFKAYCRKAGVGAHITPHSARATAITKLLADGVPHRQVQEFSRHSSVQMVEAYDKRRMGVDENPGKKLEYD